MSDSLRRVIFLLFLAMAACTESPYNLFCDDLDGDSYRTCISDANARFRYAEARAEQLAMMRLRFAERVSPELVGMTVTNDHRDQARRIQYPEELPISWINVEITPDTHPELVGNIYVVNSGLHGGFPEPGESPHVFLTDSDPSSGDSFRMVSGELLSDSQLEYLEYVCDFDGKLCRGDIYLQILPGSLIGALDTYMVGADIAPITYESAYQVFLDRYMSWLARIDSGT